MDAYLDIETTGLSQYRDDITVVGIYRQYKDGFRLNQLVGRDITREAVEPLLAGAKTLYTFNGRRFDAVFLETKLQLKLGPPLVHRDLMYECWNRGLYGGLKAVERCLGIERQLQDVSGLRAIELWWRYARWGDRSALDTLLAYNREDVLNLKTLRERLEID